MLPGLTAAQFAGVPAYLGAAQEAGTLPLAGLGPLASMGSLWSGQGTTSQTQPGGWGTQLLGAAASALPFILSDRRAKKNIKKVGEASDGLPIYSYEYKSGTKHVGPMAQDVAEYRPQAFLPNFAGKYHGINLAALGDLS
jgi:hypothetical protein